MEIILKIVCIICITLVSLAVIGSVAQRKVKEIKTVSVWLNDHDKLEDSVNKYLAEGWRLSKSPEIVHVTPHSARLVVFLEK